MSPVGPDLAALPENCTLCHHVIHHIGPDNVLVTADVRRCRKHELPASPPQLPPAASAASAASSDSSAVSATSSTAATAIPFRPSAVHTPRQTHTPHTGFDLKGSVLGAVEKLYISTTPVATQRALAAAEHCERQQKMRGFQYGGGRDSREDVVKPSQPQQQHHRSFSQGSAMYLQENLKSGPLGKECDPFWREKRGDDDDDDDDDKRDIRRAEPASPSASGYDGDKDI